MKVITMRIALMAFALAASAASAQTIRYEARVSATDTPVPGMARTTTQSACDDALRARNLAGEYHCHRLTLIAGTPVPPAPLPPPPPPGYDVAAQLALIPGFPVVTLPAAPATTSSVTVDSSASLGLALMTGAKRIACTPGATFTQPVTISQPDTLLVMDGCTISNGVGARVLTINANRVRVQGGTWTGGVAINGRSDVHVYNVDFTGLAQGSLNEVIDSRRVVIERSALRQNVPPPGAVVLWAQRSTDVVVANSKMITMLTGQATIRTHASKIVVMDSYITNPTHHVLRAHADGQVASPAVAWVRNVTEGGRIGAYTPTVPPHQVDRIWIIDNEFHWNATGTWIESPSITTGVITGNRVYDGSGGYAWRSFPGWTVTGNTSFPYAPAPTWSYR